MKGLLHVCVAKFLTVYSVDADTSIEVPPSVLPQSRYCDITGLEVIDILLMQLKYSGRPFAGTIHRSSNRPTLSRQERV